MFGVPKTGQPAIDFERAHKLRDIGGHYHFQKTGSMCRASLQSKIWPGGKYGGLLPRETIEPIFYELKKRNPTQIAKIRFDYGNTDHMRDVVHGIVSGFNPDDINLFMKRSHGVGGNRHWEWHSGDVRRKATEIKIMERVNNACSIEWIASDATLEKIWQQVKDRPIMTPRQQAIQTIKNSRGAWIAAGVTVAAGGLAYVVWQQHKKSQQDRIMLEAERMVIKENSDSGYAATIQSERAGTIDGDPFKTL